MDHALTFHDEMLLRRMLACAYCPPTLLYSADGELQDNRSQPCIDFKRDTPQEIHVKMGERQHAEMTLLRRLFGETP